MRQNISKRIKIKLLRTCIFPVATYGCESWTITKTIKKKIESFETKCYRKVLRIPWTMKMKKVDILKDLTIRENWLINDILYRKTKYFGHIKCHSSMGRTIMEGMVAGRKKVDSRCQRNIEHVNR